MSKQEDLFSPRQREPYNGQPPFQKHSDTSRDAAASVAPSIKSLRGIVLAHIRACGSHGCTMDEAQMSFRKNSQTITPRFRELALKHLIVDSGYRRETRSGRMAVVWKVSAQAESVQPAT